MKPYNSDHTMQMKLIMQWVTEYCSEASTKMNIRLPTQCIFRIRIHACYAALKNVGNFEASIVASYQDLIS